jgi:hypothetical protein
LNFPLRLGDVAQALPGGTDKVPHLHAVAGFLALVVQFGLATQTVVACPRRLAPELVKILIHCLLAGYSI